MQLPSDLKSALAIVFPQNGETRVPTHSLFSSFLLQTDELTNYGLTSRHGPRVGPENVHNFLRNTSVELVH